MTNDIKEQLTEEILNNIYFSKSITDWDASQPDNDLSNCAGLEVRIFPDDAKHINEVNSFDIIEDVMGSITTTFTRKISNERSKQDT